MLALLTAFKNKLVHVNAKSWHYKAVDWVFAGQQKSSKACSYYWIKLPFSLLAIAVFSVMVCIVAIGAWFFGFIMILSKPKEGEYYYCQSRYEGEIFYPYKTSRRGIRHPTAPWEVASVLLGIAVAYYLVFVDPSAGLYTMVGLLGLMGLGFVILMIAKGWKIPAVVRVRRGFILVWDKICPNLIVEDD